MLVIIEDVNDVPNHKLFCLSSNRRESVPRSLRSVTEVFFGPFEALRTSKEWEQQKHEHKENAIKNKIL